MALRVLYLTSTSITGGNEHTKCLYGLSLFQGTRHWTEASSPTAHGSRPRKEVVKVNNRKLLTALTAALATLGTVAAQADTVVADHQWEMRICAPPNTMPFSDVSEQGFENRIAHVLADELNAHVTFEWVAFTEDMINLYFAEGTCDIIMGVPDGFERGLTTLTYYRSPYAIVYRADAAFDIESLDDPDLANKVIGIQGLGTPPHVALAQRGLSGNVARIYGGEEGVDDRLGTLIRAVEVGEIEVGFGWGPVVSYFAERSDSDLVVKPVTPEFEPPNIFQSLPMTIAVRRNDVALRDMLNVAIATRWDEIQEILAEYRIPLTPIPPAFLGAPYVNPAEVYLEVGVVLPLPTGGRTRFAAVNDLIGEAALQGTVLAEGAINAEAATLDTDLLVRMASAPSPEAAARAAERLVVTHDVSALIGGVGEGQAEELAKVAEAYGIPFLNIGSSSAELLEQCRATTFHVEPSARTYLDAMVRLYRPGALERLASSEELVASAPAQTWYLVHEDNPAGLALARSATEAITAHGDDVVGSVALERLRPTYFDLFPAIEASGADVVLVMLHAGDQLTFMGQFEDAAAPGLLAPYPQQVTQTRNFLAAIADYRIGVDVPRLMAWETTLGDGQAGDLNTRFTSRWGQPMDSSAWTAYQALRMVQQAAVSTHSSNPLDLAAYLSDPATGFDTAKGRLAFDDNHELSQVLYVLLADPSAPWGFTLTDKLAVAVLQGTLLATPLADAAAPACR